MMGTVTPVTELRIFVKMAQQVVGAACTSPAAAAAASI
jgi:hypothetical protein